MYTIGSSYNICGKTYTFISYHHIKSLYKSLWTISLDDEATLFINSFKFKTVVKGNNQYTFNFNLNNGCLEIVGKDYDESEDYICEFKTCSNTPNYSWHGYPINHKKLKENDNFDTSIIDEWGQHNLPKNYIKRIKKGKPLK